MSALESDPSVFSDFFDEILIGKDNRRKNEKASDPCGRNLLVCCGGKDKMDIQKVNYLRTVFLSFELRVLSSGELKTQNP